ncbi:hypothetical protein [Paraburkholderia sp. 22B1P]
MSDNQQDFLAKVLNTRKIHGRNEQRDAPPDAAAKRTCVGFRERE